MADDELRPYHITLKVLMIDRVHARNIEEAAEIGRQAAKRLNGELHAVWSASIPPPAGAVPLSPAPEPPPYRPRPTPPSGSPGTPTVSAPEAPVEAVAA